jgi:hypothetical protein
MHGDAGGEEQMNIGEFDVPDLKLTNETFSFGEPAAVSG